MSQSIVLPPSVLFVCTGNIFRSLTAEYALKQHVHDASCLVASAGIEATPQPVHEWVRACLRMKGVDTSGHLQRQLTRELVESSYLVVAMGRDHQDFILKRFDKTVPLFNELCLGRDEPIKDLHEVLPAWQNEPQKARDYIWSVIDAIWNAAPGMLSHLPPLR